MSKPKKKYVPYCDKLPRPVTRPQRCAALESEGDRCKRPAKVEAYLFNNPEQADIPYWVTVNLCEYHGADALTTIRRKK